MRKERKTKSEGHKHKPHTKGSPSIDLICELDRVRERERESDFLLS
jgi:hypothetical protein